nr:sigma 54-interacting transcriptional regulator [Sedimentibacter sp.]
MGEELKVKIIKQEIDEIYEIIENLNINQDAMGELQQKFHKVEETYHDFMDNYLDFIEISDHLYDGIYISDGTGKTIFVNDAYSRITGITKDEVVGRSVLEISREGRLYKGAVTMEVIKRKEMVNSLGKSLVNDKDLLVTGSPIFDENGEVRLVVINNRDISNLKELELKNAELQNDKQRANQEIEFLRKQQTSKIKIVHEGESMKAVMDLVNMIAPTDVTVLITGESGTGKEVIVDEIYSRSLRKNKPLIKVNCAAIPGELLESELFGYEGGAFTGARKTGKMGMFELANEGTILLDEIGEMNMKLQSKLLRVLQNREIVRIGGSKSINLDIRVIAATNRDLRDEIKAGKFREDLFYRLNVVPIELKPLRERKEEVFSLSNEFLSKYNKKYNKSTELEDDAMKLLEFYKWPGNIRELENLIERLVVINKDGIIKADSLASLLDIEKSDIVQNILKNKSRKINLKEAVHSLEREIIEDVIREYGSVNKAAAILGLSQPALWKKCRVLNINVN